jgi:branched-chain amino acid transport system substrate-binding protein
MAAVSGLLKLILKSNVDVLVGPTTSPSSFAIAHTVAEARAPMITMAPTNSLVPPVDMKRRRMLKTTE